MDRKAAVIYTIVVSLLLITLVISMYYINKEEDIEKKKLEESKDIEKIQEYENKNKVNKDVLVKMNTTGEIIKMDMDEYLKGVVPAEMPPSYELEALKAQAIVARTYAYEKMTSGGHIDCDICDNYAHCQAFYTKEKLFEIWKNKGYSDSLINEYWSKVEEAVSATNAVAVIYEGEYIKAYFHANSGGKTEAASEIWGKQSIPYLVPVESLGEESHTWYKSKLEITKAELERKLNEESEVPCNIGRGNNIEILSYTVSGRVNKIRIGSNVFDATKLRTVLGLKSTNFTVEENNDIVTFNVTGYGHGVGMSQTGANYYAKKGMSFEEIIKHYYTGVELTRVE